MKLVVGCKLEENWENIQEVAKIDFVERIKTKTVNETS